MKILYASPEISPFTHGGALGTLLGELALAATKKGHEVTFVAPLRAETSPERFGLARRLDPLPVHDLQPPIDCVLYEGTLHGRTGDLRLLDHEPSFGQGLTATTRGDDHRSAFVFAQATLQLLEREPHLPDLIHCAGWQTGLLTLLLRRHDRFATIPIIFTLDDPHALGRFPSPILDELKIGYDHFNPDGVEFHGDVSLLKAGLVFADEILLPSPSLVDDLQREERGAGLHGLYAARAAHLHGISPGLSTSRWSPRAGLRLVAAYDAHDPSPKAETKAALQKELGLRRRPQSPLVLCPGPFDARDSLDGLIDAAEEIVATGLQLVFAGIADDDHRAALKRFAAGREQYITLIDAPFDDDSWHRLFGAADGVLFLRDNAERRLLLLRALRYGAIPIVANEGALTDRVVDFDVITKTGTGFRFAAGDHAALLTALRRFSKSMAVDPQAAALRTNAMHLAIDWSRPLNILEETVYAPLIPPRPEA